MPIHPFLARELRQSKRLQKFFNSLPESSRHRSIAKSGKLKKEETRLRRAQHAAEYLMEAMEAELDPPPLMKAAFRRKRPSPPGLETHVTDLSRTFNSPSGARGLLIGWTGTAQGRSLSH